MKRIRFWKTLVLTALSCLLAASFAFAQDTSGESQDSAANTPEVQKLEAAIADAASDATPVDPGVKVQELIDDYNANGMGKVFLDKMAEDDSNYYVTTTSWVKVPIDHHQWVDHRVVAYQDAFIKAQAEYMRFMSTTIRTSVIKQILNDNKAPRFTSEDMQNGSKIASLLDKFLALGDAVLNEKLVEHGVDLEQFKAAPREKKKVMLLNMIESRTIQQSQGELSGMIPVKSFEAYDEGGNYYVGVAVFASSKLKSRMKTMMSNNWDLPPRADKIGGPSVREQIVKSKKALLQDFGIRRIFDEKGYPVLISFGQSGNEAAGQGFQQKQQGREVAFKFARSAAEANFAMFLASSGQMGEETSLKSIKEKVGKAVVQGGLVSNSEEEMIELVKSLTSNTRVRGSLTNMPGIYKLYSWTMNHPANGQEVDGVILAWSPESASAAKTLKKPYEPKVRKEKKKAISGSDGVNTSRDLMDAADF